MIQKLTSHETTVSKVVDKGNHLLADSETLRFSRNEVSRLENDLKTLKAKWDHLQEKAFDAERRYEVVQQDIFTKYSPKYQRRDINVNSA